MEIKIFRNLEVRYVYSPIKGPQETYTSKTIIQLIMTNNGCIMQIKIVQIHTVHNFTYFCPYHQSYLSKSLQKIFHIQPNEITYK